ncbi:MAG: CapA family protein [Clostridia bacterium]|nr:CapA family protein [Clostridia bacterium]
MKKFIVAFIVVVVVSLGVYELKMKKQEVNIENKVKEEITIEEDKIIHMTVAGDVLCHNTNFWDAYDAKTDTYDFSYTFEDIKKYFESADIAVGTLESNFAGKAVRI